MVQNTQAADILKHAFLASAVKSVPDFVFTFSLGRLGSVYCYYQIQFNAIQHFAAEHVMLFLESISCKAKAGLKMLSREPRLKKEIFYIFCEAMYSMSIKCQ